MFITILHRKKLIWDGIYKKYLIKAEDCPNANSVMENGMYLPSGNNILNEEIDYVCEKILEVNK